MSKTLTNWPLENILNSNHNTWQDYTRLRSVSIAEEWPKDTRKKGPGFPSCFLVCGEFSLFFLNSYLLSYQVHILLHFSLSFGASNIVSPLGLIKPASVLSHAVCCESRRWRIRGGTADKLIRAWLEGRLEIGGVNMAM